MAILNARLLQSFRQRILGKPAFATYGDFPHIKKQLYVAACKLSNEVIKLQSRVSDGEERLDQNSGLPFLLSVAIMSVGT